MDENAEFAWQALRFFRFIPFLLEAAAVLATLVHPNHIVCLCSWGL
ncbi:hypothetical protein VC87395_001291 [Vibrio paracholerae 87395]|nr:hypothetical protein VCHE09_0875 [Vibrio paracholerae HE-09]EMP93420.1 hypothetical protein VC87395_001291 [Vibrio paracholerae 87395]